MIQIQFLDNYLKIFTKYILKNNKKKIIIKKFMLKDIQWRNLLNVIINKWINKNLGIKRLKRSPKLILKRSMDLKLQSKEYKTIAKKLRLSY